MEANGAAAASGKEVLPPGSMRAFLRLAGGFWVGPTSRAAWIFVGLTIINVMVSVAVQYRINGWTAEFFNALERRDAVTVYCSVLVFGRLVLFSAFLAVVQVAVRLKFQVAWRRWLTGKLISRWLCLRGPLAPRIDAPESRTVDDARIATEPVIDWLATLTNAGIVVCLYCGVLWSVGGTAIIRGHRIPGFMVIAVVIYAAAVSGMTLLLGHHLSGRVARKNAAEAKLRFELAGLRGTGGRSSATCGDPGCRDGIGRTLDDLVAAWGPVVFGQARTTLVTSSNCIAAAVIPLLLESQNYLAGRISLGAMMQTAAAFVAVQASLNWIVDNYLKVADWRASVRRVAEFWMSMDGGGAGQAWREDSRNRREAIGDEANFAAALPLCLRKQMPSARVGLHGAGHADISGSCLLSGHRQPGAVRRRGRLRM